MILTWLIVIPLGGGLIAWLLGRRRAAVARWTALLAMVLDPAGIMMITIPVFLPIIKAHGFDPLWFGILFIVNMEIGYMTPPFGFNLFYLKGIVPKGITMGDIYKSVIPYTLVELTGLVVIMLFPQIAVWLPNKLL